MSLSSAEKYLSVQSVKGRKSCVKWAWGFREKYNYTKDRDETILTTRRRSLASRGSSRNSLNHNFFHFSSHNSSYYMGSIFFAPVLSDSLPLMFLATWNVLHSEEAEGERLQTIKLGVGGGKKRQSSSFVGFTAPRPWEIISVKREVLFATRRRTFRKFMSFRATHSLLELQFSLSGNCFLKHLCSR